MKLLFMLLVGFASLSRGFHYSSRSLSFLTLRARSGTRRSFASMGFQEPVEEDLQSNWEDLYAKGEAVSAALRGEDSFSEINKSEVRIVTFDLDNTIWNTSATISAANDALFEYLDGEGIHVPTRVEVVMKELYSASKSLYSPLLEEPKGPVLLTQLRVDALCHVLEQYNGFDSDKARHYAEDAFRVWTNARHDAAARHMADSVIPCLESIASLRTSNGNPILIGAITDGNSNPNEVEGLADYFQFCINAESVGVGKPDKRVYMEAIKFVSEHPSVRDIFDGTAKKNLEDAVGPYWVHIGDDFIKDIVAAKSLNMRSVWSTELIKHKLDTKMSGTSNNKGTVDESEVEELVKRVAEMGTVEMQIGPDSYLADSLQSEFVDAIIDEFKHLSDVLSNWHKEGLKKKVSPLKDAPDAFEDPMMKSTVKEEEEDDSDPFLTVTMPDEVVNKDSSDAKTNGVAESVNTTISSIKRGFRLMRDKYYMDILAPKDTKKLMQDVLKDAQKDKSSGVFSFAAEEIESMKAGTANLSIRVGDAKMEFTKDTLTRMTVQDVMDLSSDNLVTLELFVKDTSAGPGFDVF